MKNFSQTLNPSKLLLFLFFLAFPWSGLAAHGPLKFPIILVHGASKAGAELIVGPFDFGIYFRKVPEFFSKLGVPVNQVSFPNEGDIEIRAHLLDLFIKREFPNQKVNLICHSMGGLVARYTASVLHNTQIASVTTIATPHRGTPLANWILRQRKDQTLFYRIFEALGFDMNKRKFIEQLTPEYLDSKFNISVVDRSEVQYFSVRSRASRENGTLGPFFWLANYWLSQENISLNKAGNDGVVPFLSQGWGTVIADYEYDHLAQINHYWFRFDGSERSMEIYQKIYTELLRHGL